MAIHWTNRYPLDCALLVSLIHIQWIVIYLVDSATHLYENMTYDWEKILSKLTHSLLEILPKNAF